MKKNEKINETLVKTISVIKTHVEKNGYPPTVRELMEYLSVKSTSTIAYYLDKLEEMGQIRRGSNKNRAIELVSDKTTPKNKQQNTIKIPLVGEAAAGVPILAVESYEDVYELPSNMFNSGELFMLKIKGDSMINAGIFDGDKIVVKKQSNADNRDIVVAMINGSVTVKRFFKEKNTIRLQPENDTMQPIYSTTVDILGKVVGLIRNFK